MRNPFPLPLIFLDASAKSDVLDRPRHLLGQPRQGRGSSTAGSATTSCSTDVREHGGSMTVNGARGRAQIRFLALGGLESRGSSGSLPQCASPRPPSGAAPPPPLRRSLYESRARPGSPYG